MHTIDFNKNNHEIIFSSNEKGFLKGVINNNAFTFNVEKIRDNAFHLIHENQSFLVNTILVDGLNLSFKLNNKNFSVVAIGNKQDQTLKQLVKKQNITKLITTKMPGKVVKIFTKMGDTVSKGDVLMVLEAMKMENNILAVFSGKVKRIFVSENDILTKNAQLIELE